MRIPSFQTEDANGEFTTPRKPSSSSSTGGDGSAATAVTVVQGAGGGSPTDAAAASSRLYTATPTAGAQLGPDGEMVNELTTYTMPNQLSCCRS